MDDQILHFSEKREQRRSPICRKFKFIAHATTCRGLIGDISSGGISIISKHKLIRGLVVDLEIPPFSGTVQYCIAHGKDFFKSGLRLLEKDR